MFKKWRKLEKIPTLRSSYGNSVKLMYLMAIVKNNANIFNFSLKIYVSKLKGRVFTRNLLKSF